MDARLLWTMCLALLPLLVGVGITAVLAAYVGSIEGFLFGGQAAGWQRLFVVVMLFLPIGMTLAIVEYGIRRGCERDR